MTKNYHVIKEKQTYFERSKDKCQFNIGPQQEMQTQISIESNPVDYKINKAKIYINK